MKEPLQNEILQRLSFKPLLEQTRAFHVENASILSSQGNSKAGPAGKAAPKLWNILFS